MARLCVICKPYFLVELMPYDQILYVHSITCIIIEVFLKIICLV